MNCLKTIVNLSWLAYALLVGWTRLVRRTLLWLDTGANIPTT